MVSYSYIYLWIIENLEFRCSEILWYTYNHKINTSKYYYLLGTSKYYANFLFATFVRFFMSTRFGFYRLTYEVWRNINKSAINVPVCLINHKWIQKENWFYWRARKIQNQSRNRSFFTILVKQSLVFFCITCINIW